MLTMKNLIMARDLERYKTVIHFAERATRSPKNNNHILLKTYMCGVCDHPSPNSRRSMRAVNSLGR